MSQFADEVWFTASQRRYRWSGGLGVQFVSFERGVKRGDIRMILGRLYYAYSVATPFDHWPWEAPPVGWCHVEASKMEFADIYRMRDMIFTGAVRRELLPQ